MITSGGGIPVSGFDWDAGNREKCQRHGVSIDEIEAVLMARPRIAPDPAHSIAEQRLIAIGRGRRGRPVFIAFTVREGNEQRLIRPSFHNRRYRAHEARDG